MNDCADIDYLTPHFITVMKRKYIQLPRFTIRDLTRDLKKEVHQMILIKDTEQLLNKTNCYRFTTVHNIRFATRIKGTRELVEHIISLAFETNDKSMCVQQLVPSESTTPNSTHATIMNENILTNILIPSNETKNISFMLLSNSASN